MSINCLSSEGTGVTKCPEYPSQSVNFSFPSLPILGVTALFTLLFFNMEKSVLLKLILVLYG